MKSIVLIAVLTILFLSSVSNYAVIKPRDVYGWDKARWGMTTQELENIFGRDLESRKTRVDEKDNMSSGLLLTEAIIAGSEFRASFWMNNETNKLARIVFVPKSEPVKYEWAESFIKIENYFVKKYGDPNIKKTSNDPGTSADRIWIFPSTKIELSYLKLEQSELLLLVYTDTNNSSKDDQK